MALTHERMLERMMRSDATFNGRFITGVLSTGIYCLPSCRARKPKPENVRFFDRPEAAAAAGLRACRRCRPDDFYRDFDPDRDLVEHLVARLRTDASTFADVGALASAAGIGSSKLHELFRRHYHAPPAEVLGGARVDQAAQALLTSRRSITDIAFDVGYESLSTFHDRFRRRMRLAPSEYRRLAASDAFELQLPRSFRRQDVLDYIGRDAQSRSECADGSGFAVVTRALGTVVVVRVELARERALCRLETSTRRPPAVAAAVHRQLLGILGLQQDPGPFERRILATPSIAPLVSLRRGLTIPQTRDLVEGLVWVIAGQQVSLQVAMNIRRRLTARIGQRIDDRLSALPDVAAIAELEPAELKAVGFSQRKSEYLSEIARAVVSGTLDLDELGAASATRVDRALTDIRGLGVWSVRYLMMRALGFADCVPVGDAALVRALQLFFQLNDRPGPSATQDLMAPFAPYRSLATFHLWSSLKEKPQ